MSKEELNRYYKVLNILLYHIKITLNKNLLSAAGVTIILVLCGLFTYISGGSIRDDSNEFENDLVYNINFELIKFGITYETSEDENIIYHLNYGALRPLPS